MPSPTLEAAIGGDLEETTSTTPDQVHQLVEQARGAQSVFETFSQEQVDAIVRDFGKYVYDNAEAVAAMAHKETGLGVYEDKVLKAQKQGAGHLEQSQGQEVAWDHWGKRGAEPGPYRQAHGGGRRRMPGHEPHRHADVQRDVCPEGWQRHHFCAPSQG